MNKNFGNPLKGKINSVTLIVLVIVVLVGVLGTATWFTLKQTFEVSDNIQNVKTDLNNNRILMNRLEELKSNSEYYENQKAEYDKVIADAGTYNEIDYYIELDSICRKFNLIISDIEVGKLEATGNYQSAKTQLTVTGEEIDIRRMAAEIVSQPQIARIDDISMIENGNGTVTATFAIVNFTK